MQHGLITIFIFIFCAEFRDSCYSCLSIGIYLYIEASNRQNGDRARLRSDWFILTQELCLQFWYHMYGKDVGSLNVLIKIKDSETKVWSQQGNQGDQWIHAQVPIKGKRQFQVRLIPNRSGFTARTHKI